MPTQEALLSRYRRRRRRPRWRSSPGRQRGNPGALSYYLVRQVAPVTGRDLSNARASIDENNLPAVGFSMNRAGAIKFGKLTGDNIGKPMAVILDNRVETVADHPGPHHRRRPDLRQLHARRTSRTSR